MFKASGLLSSESSTKNGGEYTAIENEVEDVDIVDGKTLMDEYRTAAETTYFGPDHPYFMPENMFDDFNKSLGMIDKWKSMHNGSSVLVDKTSVA
ncbi:hypothetical protein CCHL11_09821 [Colletotrichum chlorophyti]|uniref:Uncharacterized protein n=1 Tax=Colletotrichum chlorophyti TaxID=708187 RepID=A0A1Q8RAQ5_9PEZI|nr:hypothetical protein CCHL11_09821 [Colletotrichum chlorophyti]